ncbi:MAG TPA: hypothetical protein VLL49_05300, partial [Anaerolineales bacterium]|nr:hypothetical protein [Anaerolineales bacterium]
ATDASTLFQVPAEALRALMSKPALGQLILAKMSERLNRLALTELPRFAGVDQEVMRDLRTATAEE